MSEITLLDGMEVANEMKKDLKGQLKRLNKQPKLAIILVGNKTESSIYVRKKIDLCEEIGIDYRLINYDSNVEEEKLLMAIEDLNQDETVDGIICQLPLPKQISQDKVIKKIDPNKDVDGFHPDNLGKMLLNKPTLLPATPYGIMELFDHYNLDLYGKNCVVIGRSNIVGLPMSIMMGNDNMCTVTSCHHNTRNLDFFTKNADIIIIGIGKPNFLKADMIKTDCIVIDIGINRIEDKNSPKGYKIVGDVDFENVGPKASYITPVPGGVGPMTVAALLKNVIKAVKMKMK